VASGFFLVLIDPWDQEKKVVFNYRYEELLQRTQSCDFCRTLAEHGEVRELARRHRLPEEAWFQFQLFSDSNDGGGEGKGGIRVNRIHVTLAPRYFVQLL
jgi:hypothetical protein